MSAAGTNAGATLELRLEAKLTGPELALPRVRQHLRLAAALLRPQFPARTVQSVYLDTPRRAALDACRDGLAERRKVRLRWYGDEDARVAGALEIKERVGGWVEKRRIELADTIAVADRPRGELVRALRAASAPNTPPELDADLEPVQWIAYRREYLVSASSRVRVTLDTRLRAHDVGLRGRLSREAATRLPRLFVLEVKAAREDADEARRLLAALPLTPGRCSKYALACDPRDAAPLVDLLPADARPGRLGS